MPEDPMNQKLIWKLTGLAILVLSLCCSQASGQSIITFEAPGAGTTAGQGTLAEGINAFGTTYGYYIDGGSVAHGFIRPLTGSFTTFSAPGAGTAARRRTHQKSPPRQITTR
jgi:hypothetical protein